MTKRYLKFSFLAKELVSTKYPVMKVSSLPTRAPHMTPIDVSHAKISILEDPWEFKVKLDS
jgi:hypothetical protein